MGARLLKSFNRFTACSSYLIELKLDRMIPDINPHNHSKLNFPTPRGRCGGARLQIFISIHSVQYSSDCAETWHGNARHQSAQSLWAGFLKCMGRSPEFQNSRKFAVGIFTCSLSCRRRNLEISISPIWEMTAASVRRYFYMIIRSDRSEKWLQRPFVGSGFRYLLIIRS